MRAKRLRFQTGVRLRINGNTEVVTQYPVPTMPDGVEYQIADGGFIEFECDGEVHLVRGHEHISHDAAEYRADKGASELALKGTNGDQRRGSPPSGQGNRGQAQAR